VRQRLAAVIAAALVLAGLAGGCAAPAAPPDAYDLLSTATKTVWDPVQINVGAVVADGTTTMRIESSDIALVVADAGRKSAIHLSLPAAVLGVKPQDLHRIGIDGDTIDVDTVYDGEKLYARSPLLGPSLRLLLGPSGKVPSGDLTGWLAFGSVEEFAALSNLMGTTPVAPSAAPSGGPAQTLKATLAEAGITLSIAGTETHAGATAHHLTIAVDSPTLLGSPYFDAATRAQLGKLGVSIAGIVISGDVWIDQTAGRVVEVDIRIGSTDEPDRTAEITVTFRDPDGSVSVVAPSGSVAIPIGDLVAAMMKLITKGAES